MYPPVAMSWNLPSIYVHSVHVMSRQSIVSLGNFDGNFETRAGKQIMSHSQNTH